MTQTLIEKALATVEEYEADAAVSWAAGEPPAMPFTQMLVLAIYSHELRRRRRTAPGDARPQQLIKAARDASIPEDEIQAALDVAATNSRR